jgi:succinate dehydrogenase / fumarate reductase, membrane anchor subunit
MVKHRLREAVGAHYGLGDWMLQRVTALVMAAYTLLFLAIVLWNGGMSYETWRAIFATGPFRVATFVFMAALLYHAWIGVRNMSMDYVKPLAVRLALQLAVIVLAIGYLGWTIQILWSR